MLLSTPRSRTGGSWWMSALEKMSATIWSLFGLWALVHNCNFRTITDPALMVSPVVTQETSLRPTRPWVTSSISCVLPGMANTEGQWGARMNKFSTLVGKEVPLMPCKGAYAGLSPVCQQQGQKGGDEDAIAIAVVLLASGWDTWYSNVESQQHLILCCLTWWNRPDPLLHC